MSSLNGIYIYNTGILKCHHFFYFFFIFLCYNNPMTIEMKRPERKFQDVKVSETDIVLFTLGIDRGEFILPSERESYLTDLRAVTLLEDIKAGKDVSGKDYTGINLKGADISGVNFKGCNFSKAIIYQTKAKDCNFEGANFADAYMEESDFSGSSFEGSVFKRVFLRNNNFKNACLDEDVEKYLSDFDKFLSLVESGKIDIHSLSKSDLLCVDIRRLDLTKVDLIGLDLSNFALDGINLTGTYIDPKQLLSLKGLQKYYFDLRRTKEKKKKKMEEEILKENEEKLRLFGQKNIKKDIPQEITMSRPDKKEDDPDSYRLWPQSLDKSRLYNNDFENKIGVTEDKKEDDETPVLIKKEIFANGSKNAHSFSEEIDSTEENQTRKVASKMRDVRKVRFKTKG